MISGEVIAKAVEELVGIRSFLLPIQQLAHPRHLIDLFGVATMGAAGFLVAPMSSNTEFGLVVHVIGADLHLQGLNIRAHHSGVQRLVHPVLGRGNVVLEASRHRVVQRMNRAHRGVTIAHGIHQNADAHQVKDLIKLVTPDNHLLVDRPIVLGPAHDLSVQAELAHGQLDLVFHFGQVLIPLGRAIGHEANDLIVFFRIEDGEREILELPLHRCHAQAVSQRGNDFEGLLRFLSLLFWRQESHGAHVVQAVGHLDHQHAGIVSHGHHHLADGFCLGG